jgi:hypothetical protein
MTDREQRKPEGAGGEPGRRIRDSAKRRRSTQPLVTVAKAEHKEAALAGLERWKARHPDAAAHLEAADVLVDSMRGRYHTWTRIRVNLQHVPESLRPPQEALDPDETIDGWHEASGRPASKSAWRS